jgi:hypothetical protein
LSWLGSADKPSIGFTGRFVSGKSARLAKETDGLFRCLCRVNAVLRSMRKGDAMAGGGIFLDGQWLAVGTRVAIVRPGYAGRCGLFKGKSKNGKLLVNLEGVAGVKLHLHAGEIRRIATSAKT